MSRLRAAWEQSKLLPMATLGVLLFAGIVVVRDSLLLAFAVLALNVAVGVEDHVRESRRRSRALVELLRHHNARAVSADRRLRDHARSEGLESSGPMTAAWRQDGLPQMGRASTGDTYRFHGVGCVIGLPDERPVDIDWEPDGRVLVDLFHIQRWVEGSGIRHTSEEAVAAAMQQLVLNGEVEPAGRGKYRLPSRDVDTGGVPDQRTPPDNTRP